MGGNTRKSNGEFNRNSGAKAALPESPTMAMIIDIQGAGGMDREDAKAYFEKLGNDIESLRKRGITVTWVTMGARNHLYAPTEGGSEGRPRYRNDGTNPHDFDDLVKMGFHGVKSKHGNSDIFRQFMREHGPRTNEAVYTKFFKGAFVEPEDYQEGDALYKHLENDYRKDEKGNPVVPLPKAGDYRGPTLRQYVESRGTKDVLVMGAFSTNCDIETALSGQQKGLRTHICTDRVISWEADEKDPNLQKSLGVWRHNAAKGNPNAFHENKINARLDEIAANETGARGISAADVERVRNNMTTLDEVIASTPVASATMRHAPSQAMAPT